MKSLVVIIACSLIALPSCKKDSPGVTIPVGNLNNELTATVEVNTVTSQFKANGNYTTFGKRTDPNGDTVIHFSGSNEKSGADRRAIQVTLVNITAPGTYSFKIDQNSKQSAFCDYTVGYVFFSPIFELYSTRGVNNMPGTITIEAISPLSIKGSFSANCGNYALITNGRFKGDF